MGGGDLNLKKSWHPQTLRNVEKVWKAEQKHEAERKKIEELQRELQEERAREEMQRYAEDMGTVRKREEKLEWMYQGPGGMVNRDEYLLGRPVDKFILDKVGDRDGASGDSGLLPGSIFARAGASSVLDMATKIREDPLFMIRKKEEEKKREVLNNPVKMKKIKALLQNSLDKKERKRKKEKKKKHKKHRRRSSSSDSSSSEEEKGRNKSQKRVENSSWKAAPSKIPGYGLQVRDPEPSRRSRSSPCQERPRQRSRSSSRSPQSHSSRRNPARSSGSPCRHSKQHSSREEKGRARSPSPKKSFRRQQPSGYTRKISPEELERKRQEMMENAKWREEERANNLRKHRKEEELERELEKLDARDGKFFHRLKLESASTSSLEDRVKRNIHSLQRTPAALEKNFMQR
ncbi:pre-mRNA-splicing factor CWC25 homolog [Poecile atricapillus]|uniref:pre-mRNA-splicing factor CWC25 homolog n=1 Tax=Pseudopodoces humilis TaxID=181119 RepID=UPI0003959DA6|nr:PREDICTED: pre-mRNA-splicing factor CWC25 homolog [Pseudopodoces humilis]XP_058714089.1 pre-mRNA-splicing factor CWC25 homolog [Poecile atricapillus]